MDKGLWFGFEPSSTHNGWPYVDIGTNIEIVTMVGAKCVWSQFDRVFSCGYGSRMSYSRSCIYYAIMVGLDGGCYYGRC